MAVPLAVSFIAISAVPVAGKASPRDCSSWTSLTQPPRTIRVLRRKSNRVEVVDFKKYVITVMGKEWPSYLPMPVVAAGAVAVKQYAWYHTIYTSRASDGRCFDVKDGTGDQLYKPNRARVRPDHHVAIDMTWGVTLRKQGRFLMTGYRRGGKARCGRDATGYKLFAKSAIRCAEKGWGWQQILKTYYGPGVELVGTGSGGGTGDAAPASSSASASSASASSASAPSAAGTAARVIDATPARVGVEETLDSLIADRRIVDRSAIVAAPRGWWMRNWARYGDVPTAA
ncbi:MAG: SpoIID/LytB domain-containing protein [Candidatus Limnocylindrales bacterium]